MSFLKHLRDSRRVLILAGLFFALATHTAQAAFRDGTPPYVDCRNYLIAKPVTLPYSPELLQLFQSLPVDLSDEALENLARSISHFQRHVLVPSLLRSRTKLKVDWEANARMVDFTDFFMDEHEGILWGIQEFRIGHGGAQYENQRLIQAFSLKTGLPQKEKPEILNDEDFLLVMYEMQAVGPSIPRLRDPAHLKNGILSVLSEEGRLLVIRIQRPNAHVLYDGLQAPGVHIVRQMELLEKDALYNLTILSNRRTVRVKIER